MSITKKKKRNQEITETINTESCDSVSTCTKIRTKLVVIIFSGSTALYVFIDDRLDAGHEPIIVTIFQDLQCSFFSLFFIFQCCVSKSALSFS